MIYFPLSAVSRSSEVALNPAATLAGDGQVMVSALVNGVAMASPSAGVATEQFIGFSVLSTSAAPFVPTTAVKVQEIVIPVSGLVTVARTPLAGTVFAYDNSAGSAITVVSVAASVVDLGAANAGKTARVQYRYTLSVVEARSIVGDIQPGNYAGTSYGTVGVAQTGVIYTDQFNSGVNFAAATSLKTDVNGRISDQTASGATVNAIVKYLPTLGNPFLGLEFNAV